jgi:hypothetical protein
LSWGHCTRCWGQNNYPQWSGTRPLVLDEIFIEAHRVDQFFLSRRGKPGFDDAEQGDLAIEGAWDKFSLRIFGDKAFGDETVHQAGDGMA